MEQVRAFIAIELPDKLKLELARLQAILQQANEKWIKWVHPNGIHLTLKFLGNVNVDKVGDITRAMEAAVQGIRPFHLEVSNLGAFPNLRQVQVVWVGIGGEIDRLRQLQQHVESQLLPLGFSAEKRVFTAHLTLARFRNQAPLDGRQRLGQLIAATDFKSNHIIEVEAINLMKSQLTREGAIYSKITTVGLNKPLPNTSA